MNASSSAPSSIRPAAGAARSDVMPSASSGGNSLGRPVRVDPDPDDRPRIVRPEPVGLAEDAGQLADARHRSSIDEVVRPLQADRAAARARRPPPPRRPSRGSSPRRAARPDPGASHVGRKPSDRRSARPGGAVHVRPSRPRPAVCSSATARQTSGVAVRQPAADDVVRRADDGEALLAGDERRLGSSAGSGGFDRLRPLQLERLVERANGRLEGVLGDDRRDPDLRRRDHLDVDAGRRPARRTSAPRSRARSGSRRRRSRPSRPTSRSSSRGSRARGRPARGSASPSPARPGGS